MISVNKEIICKSNSPIATTRLDDKNPPKGRKIPASVKPKDVKKEKPK